MNVRVGNDLHADIVTTYRKNTIIEVLQICSNGWLRFACAESPTGYRSEGSMNGKVLGQTGKGTFTITEVNSAGWGRLKSGSGWIYLLNPSYCTVGSSTVASSVPYTVKVSISDLNIRKGPGTGYAKVGKYTGKGVFTIVKESSGVGSTNGWGLLKSYQKNADGCISLDYCEKV